jgi:glucoamylase
MTDWVPSGRVLRFELFEPAFVHWSADGWKTTHDSTAEQRSMGTYIADVKTAGLLAGSAISFTIFWTERNRWEGRDFQLEVTEH